MHNKAICGLLSGVVLVVVTLIGVAMLNMPSAESAAARIGARTAACQRDRPRAEQGYGVTQPIPGCASIN